MKAQLDFNRRRDPQLFPLSLSLPSLNTVGRVASVGASFLSLHKGGSKVVGVIGGGIQVIQGISGLYHGIYNRQWREIGISLYQIVVSTTTVALMILFPIGHLVMSQSLHLIRKIYHVSQHLMGFEWKALAYDLLEIVASLAFAASIFYALPEYIVLSMLLQALTELSTSISEFSKGRYLEALSGLVLSGLRSYHAKDSVLTLKRNYFGKKLDQAGWNEVIAQSKNRKWEKMSKGEHNEEALRMDLEAILIEKGYSSHIQKIEAKEADLSGFHLKNLHLNQVNLEKANLTNVKIERVQFNHCNMKEALWNKSSLSHTSFAHTDLTLGNFYQASLYKTHFVSSNLLRSAFVRASIQESSFDKSSLEEASFLFAKVKDSSIKRSDVTLTLLCGTKDQFKMQDCIQKMIYKPVIALGWNFDGPLSFAKLISQVVKDQGGVALLYPLETDIDSDAVNEEVKLGLNIIRSTETPPPLSIAHSLLNQERQSGSAIDHIRAEAQEVIKFSDGIILPGGVDVEKVFYDPHAEIRERDYYTRSLMELALIEQTQLQKKSLMGVCRGSQISNVYFGGTLRDVDFQMGASGFDFIPGSTEAHALFHEAFGSQLVGLSMHHQASDKIGQGLHVIYKKENIPKLLVNADASIILTQFHPEYYVEVQPKDWKMDAAMLDIAKLKGRITQEKYEKALYEAQQYAIAYKKLLDNRKVYELFFQKIKQSQAA